MPKGGFGNLIALPLQKGPRQSGGSIFVDASLQPYPVQWAFLASVIPMNAHDIEPTILRATGNTDPLDVTFINEDDFATPWRPEKSSGTRLNIYLPDSLKISLANLIYFEKAQLPQALASRLIRLAAFQNPEFYKAQAMRMSVWDKPRVIGCAENYPQHIALPRGCLETALSLLHDNGISSEIIDERFTGAACDVTFLGKLRQEQEAAVSELLLHDCGVLCGKHPARAVSINRPLIYKLDILLTYRRISVNAGHLRLAQCAPQCFFHRV